VCKLFESASRWEKERCGYGFLGSLDNRNYGSRCKFAELRVFLLSLLGYKGLHIYHTTIAGEACAAEIAERQKLDMDDAIQYSSALCVKAEAIISFDKHFNNLGILRKDPCEVE
jgi:predicted nucleic acid-binding protein